MRETGADREVRARLQLRGCCRGRRGARPRHARRRRAGRPSSTLASPRAASTGTPPLRDRMKAPSTPRAHTSWSKAQKGVRGGARPSRTSRQRRLQSDCQVARPCREPSRRRDGPGAIPASTPPDDGDHRRRLSSPRRLARPRGRHTPERRGVAAPPKRLTGSRPPTPAEAPQRVATAYKPKHRRFTTTPAEPPHRTLTAHEQKRLRPPTTHEPSRASPHRKRRTGRSPEGPRPAAPWGAPGVMRHATLGRLGTAR